MKFKTKILVWLLLIAFFIGGFLLALYSDGTIRVWHKDGSYDYKVMTFRGFVEVEGEIKGPIHNLPPWKSVERDSGVNEIEYSYGYGIPPRIEVVYYFFIIDKLCLVTNGDEIYILTIGLRVLQQPLPPPTPIRAQTQKFWEI